MLSLQEVPGGLWIKIEGNDGKAKKEMKALKQERVWHLEESKRKQEGGEPLGGG